MLTKFKLVNTQGLKGLHFKGDTIPFDQLDDALAEQLLGKTHVLERLAEVPQQLSEGESPKKKAE